MNEPERINYVPFLPGVKNLVTALVVSRLRGKEREREFLWGSLRI